MAEKLQEEWKSLIQNSRYLDVLGRDKKWYLAINEGVIDQRITVRYDGHAQKPTRVLL